MQQRPRRHRTGPVTDTDEHHRRDRLRGCVVVLASVLEDLPYRPGGAGEEDDAAGAQTQQESSRNAFWKYFAIDEAKMLGGSWP